LQGKVEICGVATGKLKVLKNEETMALLHRAHAGDRQARDELVSGNLRLVLSVIQKFTGRSDNADDLFQVGCIGLLKAIDNFNTDLDVRFSTYGVPMIVPMSKRNHWGTSVMTGKRDLNKSTPNIKIVKINKQMNEQMIRNPNLCKSEPPHSRWSKETIFDACDRYIAEHDGVLRPTDFHSKRLPSRSAVKNRFGITLKEFRDTYYPLPAGHQKKAHSSRRKPYAAFVRSICAAKRQAWKAMTGGERRAPPVP